MTVDLCRHIKTNGKACNSPALTGQAFCYFHRKLRTRHRDLVAPKPTRPAETVHEIVFDAQGFPSPQALPAPQPSLADAQLDLPLLEDRESVQVAISLVISAIAHNRIDTRRAAAILYGLQLASNNSTRIITEPFAGSLCPEVARGASGLDLVPKHIRTAPEPAATRPRKRRPEAEGADPAERTIESTLPSPTENLLL